MTRMTETELLRVWDGGAQRMTWERVRALHAGVDGMPERLAMAEDKLAGLPAPLVALAANADLVRRLVGQRWFVVLLAIEGGATWAEVAEALEIPEDDAVGAYTAAIDAQAAYVPGHDAARARAVLPGAGVDR
jgi:hypothetical protein